MAQLSLHDQYVKRILDSETAFGSSKGDSEVGLAEHKKRISVIVTELVADVTTAIGKGQREGMRVTALALGYSVLDRGSIADMTKKLVKAVERSTEAKMEKRFAIAADDEGESSDEEHNDAKAD
jgi:hypothetical protein